MAVEPVGAAGAQPGLRLDDHRQTQRIRHLDHLLAVKRAAAKGENLSADAVMARLRSQISIEKKRELADYIIDNSGDLAALKPQVAGLYQKLKEL